MKLSQLARRNYQHLIVFGDPKSGKSTLAAEMLLHGFNLTWISMDNGHTILWKLPIPIEQLDRQLNIVVIPDTKEAPTAIRTCLKLVSGAETNICDKHGQVDCTTCKRDESASWSTVALNQLGPRDIVVFDHLGQLANSAMSAIFIKGKKTDDDKPEWEDYAKQGTLMDRFLTNIQQAPYNVICLTHVCESEMEDGKKRLVPLVGTTNFSRNAGKYFDHVVHCEVSNKDHKFGSSTVYATRILTGSRTDVAIEKEKVASLEKFFDGSAAALAPELAGSKAAERLLSVNLREADSIEQPVAEQEKPLASPAEPVHTPKPATSTSSNSSGSAAAMLAAMKRGR